MTIFKICRGKSKAMQQGEFVRQFSCFIYVRPGTYGCLHFRNSSYNWSRGRGQAQTCCYVRETWSVTWQYCMDKKPTVGVTVNQMFCCVTDVVCPEKCFAQLQINIHWIVCQINRQLRHEKACRQSFWKTELGCVELIYSYLSTLLVVRFITIYWL